MSEIIWKILLNFVVYILFEVGRKTRLRSQPKEPQQSETSPQSWIYKLQMK